MGAAKVECLADSEVRREEGRPSAKIARNDFIPRRGQQVECSVLSYSDCGASQARAERRPISKQRVSIAINARSDVKRCAGEDCDQRVQADTPAYTDRSSGKEPMADIICGAAIFAAEIVLVGREAGRSIGIAVGPAKRVDSEKRERFVQPIRS